VAEIASADRIGGIVLFHVLAPLPPALLEHSGNPESRTSLMEAQAEYREEVEAAESSLLLDFKTELLRSGVDGAAILSQMSPSVDDNEVAPLILSVARDQHCDTVVVGRESHFGIRKRLFRHHVADQVVRHSEGLCVWIVG
jgi:nucleotide-binding universal stress UspA family protein